MGTPDASSPTRSPPWTPQTLPPHGLDPQPLQAQREPRSGQPRRGLGPPPPAQFPRPCRNGESPTLGTPEATPSRSQDPSPNRHGEDPQAQEGHSLGIPYATTSLPRSPAPADTAGALPGHPRRTPPHPPGSPAPKAQRGPHLGNPRRDPRPACPGPQSLRQSEGPAPGTLGVTLSLARLPSFGRQGEDPTLGNPDATRLPVPGV
nr:proline-rich protein 2-like [Oryctolagus cuniculus]